jgi:hypothetical protein
MKNTLALLFLAPFIMLACKAKNKEEEKRYVSVISLIKKQAAHIDTSLYAITKVVTMDSLHSDTTYIPREEFIAAAKDFTDIPDLSDPKVAKRFKEENRYDSLIKKVIITYTPIDPTNEIITKQELLVSTELTREGDNKVTHIIIEKGRTDRNGSFTQSLLWRMDKSFLITTTTQKPGEPEKTTITKVAWNDDEF